MFSVRGIGVAERVSTSTWRVRSLSRSFCPTPKRCSSSTTSSPKSWKRMSLENSRCVPISTSTSPRSSSLKMRLVCCAVWKRLITATLTGKPSKRCTAV